MKFDSKFFGAQGVTSDDHGYVGSRYAEVKEAMFRNAYYQTWRATGEPPLPTYEVTLSRVLKGLALGWRPWQFRQAAERAVDSRADLRWGADRKGYRRLLHPNGVCLFGRWIIDAEQSPYSGYFHPGSEALIIARYSTCCTETRRGYYRSLSMVGKLYPTTDEHHVEQLETANFITQEDLGGEKSTYINDAILRNAPDVTPWRRGWGAPILILSGLLFKFVDVEAAIRQLHPIAELGKSAEERTQAPRFMQLTVDNCQPRNCEETEDFRDEVLSHLYAPGAEQPSGNKLVFHIDVSDEGRRRGLLRQRWNFVNWKRIGRIEFTEAVASYNGDFVIHFSHPNWRKDRNDPSTASRQN